MKNYTLRVLIDDEIVYFKTEALSLSYAISRVHNYFGYGNEIFGAYGGCSMSDADRLTNEGFCRDDISF
jgi:hypothetical protein